MSLHIQCLTIDCDDLDATASFWAQALGYRRTFEDPSEVVIEPPEGSPGPDLLFLRVPDRKQAKNRLHLDLRPADQGAEVERLMSLGATRADIGQTGEESWVVLADPEGNEFCVLRALSGSEGAYEGNAGFTG